ncbi:hypothetical protein ACVV62_09380 [Streptococcus pluranimalium]
METHKVKDTYFKLNQESELVDSLDLQWVLDVALPYLNGLVDGKEKISDTERDNFRDQWKIMYNILSETRQQAISIKTDQYLTTRSKRNLLEDLVNQRTPEALKANDKLKKQVVALEKIVVIATKAHNIINSVSSKTYGILGVPSTPYQRIGSIADSALKDITNGNVIGRPVLEGVSETIRDYSDIHSYRLPESPEEAYRDSSVSSEFGYAIDRWIKQNYPHLLGEYSTYQYNQMFANEASKHNLTVDQFKVKIYSDYVEWKEQELINQRLKEDLFTQKIDEVPKQDNFINRFKKTLGLS